jgi:microcystin-dependent protein
MADPFVAEIRIFPFNFAPTGWAFCNGQLLPISQNTALFALLGTVYGGDGKSTFALPDMQGNAPMQPGQGSGLSLRDLGQTSGVETSRSCNPKSPSIRTLCKAATSTRPPRPPPTSCRPRAFTTTVRRPAWSAPTAPSPRTQIWLSRRSASPVAACRTTICSPT